MLTAVALYVVALALSAVALAPASGKADDETQGRKACMADAIELCSSFIPDRHLVADCLMANRNQISEPCRILIQAH
jgi:hypothetical protein